MIKAVIFDIDNTLYSYDDTHPAALAAVCEYGQRELGIPGEELAALLKQHNKTITAELGPQASIHNRMLRYLRIMEEKHLPLYYAYRMNRLYWDTLIAASQPSPGAADCMKALKAAGYTIGIGTDMTLDFQLEKLEHLQLLQYIDFVVSSEEAGAEKPSLKLFALCARKAGVQPEECLFIGDSLKKDVQGAAAAGMKSVWYSAETQPGVISVSHFSELPEIVSKL